MNTIIKTNSTALLTLGIRYMLAISKFNTYKDVKISNSEITKNYMRSSGPGGQSVNTTNSKAEVRVLINHCAVID